LSSGRVTIAEGDIRDRKLLAEVIHGINLVFHQAAIRITQCAEDPRLALEVLVDGTFDVAEQAVKSKVSTIVAASSISVYRRRWQLFVTAVATTAGLALLAALYLQLRGAYWIQDYLHNAQGFVTANSIDDFSTANPDRFTLINLQVPFFSITGHSSSGQLAGVRGGRSLAGCLALLGYTRP
jgi:hypothetical protein